MLRRNWFLIVFSLLVAAPGSTRADFILTTGSPPGSPLTAAAGDVSGPLALSTYSTDPTRDVMAAWNVRLMILADAGTSGTLTFQAPDSGTAPAPAGYIFAGDGLGISVDNLGVQLAADDFYDPAAGPGVPGLASPGANLLSMNFRASADASGLFGIYAVRGAENTQWTDPSITTRYFSNVPAGTGMVRIGEVYVVPVVPEPSSIIPFALGFLALAGVQPARRALLRVGWSLP